MLCEYMLYGKQVKSSFGHFVYRPSSASSSVSSQHSHHSGTASSVRLGDKKVGNKKNHSSERKVQLIIMEIIFKNVFWLQKNLRKHYKVLAQSNNDGFYYPGK